MTAMKSKCSLFSLKDKRACHLLDGVLNPVLEIKPELVQNRSNCNVTDISHKELESHFHLVHELYSYQEMGSWSAPFHLTEPCILTVSL